MPAVLGSVQRQLGDSNGISTAHPDDQDALVMLESDLGWETRLQTYGEVLSVLSPFECGGILRSLSCLVGHPSLWVCLPLCLMAGLGLWVLGGAAHRAEVPFITSCQRYRLSTRRVPEERQGDLTRKSVLYREMGSGDLERHKTGLSQGAPSHGAEGWRPAKSEQA